MEEEGKARDVLLHQILPNRTTADEAFYKLSMFVAVYGRDWRKCIATAVARLYLSIPLTLEHRTDRLSRTAGKKLPLYVA
jgi:hypothetical protein